MTAPIPDPKASTPDIPHWAHVGESTFVAGMWFLYQMHRFLGRWPFLLFL